MTTSDKTWKMPQMANEAIGAMIAVSLILAVMWATGMIGNETFECIPAASR